MSSGIVSKGLSRRRFIFCMAGAGMSGSLLFNRALNAAVQQIEVARPGKPLVRVVFLRPRGEYWLGWPGKAWDVNGAIKKFTGQCKIFGDELGVKIEPEPAPLYDDEAVNAFINRIKGEKPHGVIVFPLHMNHWTHVNRIAKCGTPAVVFAPLGVAFTGHLQTVSDEPGVYLASSGDFDLKPVRFGLKMMRTAHDISNTKIAVLRGNETKESVLDGLGLKLRYLPRQRFADEFHAMEETQEMIKIADETASGARSVVEPTKQDILNAVKNHFVACKIMKEEGCQGITMDCLGLVADRKIPSPPCLAWARLLDSGITATCEADINAVMSHNLCCRLLDKPGFQQDPVPDTVNNTLIGAHCVCATRLSGYGQPAVPYSLRSHSESDLGVSFQIHWPIGKEVTIMQFTGPKKMILGQGKVVANHDTPPAGGCRTSVELDTDWPEDAVDTKGFHQLFIFGEHVRDFEAYGQVYGIETEHI